MTAPGLNIASLSSSTFSPVVLLVVLVSNLMDSQHSSLPLLPSLKSAMASPKPPQL
jgi:hypothetical protein